MAKVLLTQSKDRLQGLQDLLEAQGLVVEHQPFIKTVTLKNAYQDAQALLDCEWMLFSSQAAIEAWLELTPSLPKYLPKSLPKHIRYGAVGQKTAERLQALGLQVEVIGKPQSAEGLADVFVRRFPNAKSVALPVGNLRLTVLKDRLTEANIPTKSVVIYRTDLVDVKDIKVQDVDTILFASPSATQVLQAGLQENNIFLNKNLVAIGQTTAEAIRKLGFRCSVAETPSIEAIAEAILKVSTYRESKF